MCSVQLWKTSIIPKTHERHFWFAGILNNSSLNLRHHFTNRQVFQEAADLLDGKVCHRPSLPKGTLLRECHTSSHTPKSQDHTLCRLCPDLAIQDASRDKTNTAHSCSWIPSASLCALPRARSMRQPSPGRLLLLANHPSPLDVEPGPPTGNFSFTEIHHKSKLIKTEKPRASPGLVIFLHHSECWGDFPGGSVAKDSPANAGDTGSIPGLGRSPGVK